jgi:hypothetical protein
MGPGFSTASGYPPWQTFATGDDPESALFSHDLNGNGFLDAIVFKVVGGKRAPPQIVAVDGQNHQELWSNDEIFQFMIGSGMPLRIIDDTNGDAVIVIGSGRWGVQGADIHILDGNTGGQLNIIEYEEQTEFADWNMAQPVQRISAVGDVTGDGLKDYIVQRTATIDDESVDVVELVDIQSGQLIRQIPIGNAVVKDNGDINSDGRTDILMSQGNSLYCLSGAYSLSIQSPNDDRTADDRLLLEWNLKGVDCEVFVDGISYGHYTSGEAELTLSPGEHVIIVETTDEFGGVLSDSITVTVPESNTPWIINITAVIALIIFIIVIFVIRRSKLKKREEHWRAKRKELESSKDADIKKSPIEDEKPRIGKSRRVPQRRSKRRIVKAKNPEIPDMPSEPEEGF